MFKQKARRFNQTIENYRDDYACQDASDAQICAKRQVILLNIKRKIIPFCWHSSELHKENLNYDVKIIEKTTRNLIIPRTTDTEDESKQWREKIHAGKLN